MATLCKNLVNFDPVTPEFKSVKGVHRFVDQQFGYAALLLDLAGISTEFSRAINTQFCFSYSLGGVAAIPRGLHARLCHSLLLMFRQLERHISVSVVVEDCCCCIRSTAHVVTTLIH